MARLRPSGSGRPVTATAFLRATATPTAALVVDGGGLTPDGWPTTSGAGAADSQLGHTVGWVCEVRRDHIALINPLGEGLFRAPLPALPDAWVHDVRSTTERGDLRAPPSGRHRTGGGHRLRRARRSRGRGDRAHGARRGLRPRRARRAQLALPVRLRQEVQAVPRTMNEPIILARTGGPGGAVAWAPGDDR